MDLIVRYEFTDEMPVAAFKMVYNVLIDICRLLTNRKNACFDKIGLFQIDDETDKCYCFADGLIDYPYKTFTKKIKIFFK